MLKHELEDRVVELEEELEGIYNHLGDLLGVHQDESSEDAGEDE